MGTTTCVVETRNCFEDENDIVLVLKYYVAETIISRKLVTTRYLLSYMYDLLSKANKIPFVYMSCAYHRPFKRLRLQRTSFKTDNKTGEYIRW